MNTNLLDMDINCTDDIDAMCNGIQKAIIETSDICVPKSKFCSYRKPYWSDELGEIHAKQKSLRRIWIQQGRPRGYEYPSYKNYKEAKPIFAKALSKAVSTYEQSKYDDIGSYHDMDIKAFWKYVRKRKDIDDNMVVMRDDNNTYETPESQLDMWKKHYKRILNVDTVELDLASGA